MITTTVTALALSICQNNLLSQTLVETVSLTVASTIVDKVAAYVNAMFFSQIETPPFFQESWPELEQFVSIHEKELLEINQNHGFIHHGDWEAIKGGATKSVLFHKKLPEFVFKVLRTQTPQALESLQESVKNYQEIRQICMDHHLDKIKIPRAYLLQKIGEKAVAILVEENVPLDYTNSVRHIIRMNKDPESQKTLNEMIAQKGILVYRSQMSDIKENNIGIAKDGKNVAIVDVDSKSDTFYPGTYALLIKHLYKSNIDALRQALIKEDPEFFKNFDFESQERQRLVVAEREEDFERFKTKYHSLTDPVICPPTLLDQLPWDQKMVAEELITVFNSKLANQDFNHLERELTYESGTGLSWNLKTPFKKKWELDPSHTDVPWYAHLRFVEKQVLDLFVQEGVIHSYDDRYAGHGRTVYC